MYTHCPNCDTHFEISQEYLNIANGKVRCGQCDHIFNALDNLYDKPGAIPGKAQTADKKSDESSGGSDIRKAEDSDIRKAEGSDTRKTETTQLNKSIENTSVKKPLFDDASPSIPSFNIKEKMERITASLSAATAELKSARKSTVFQDSSTLFQESSTSTQESSTSAQESSTPVQESSTSTQKSSTPIQEPSPPVQEPSTVNESPSKIKTPVKEKTVDANESLNIDKPLDSKESLESEDEFEIVNFNDNELDEIPASSITDFNPRNIDEGDIDILNSLMDGTAQNSSNNELLDELDDINKTLSGSSNSLDDELSNIEDDLDNGDDLLAELEQLESDFLNKDQISTSGSPSAGSSSLLQAADGSSSPGSEEVQSATSSGTFSASDESASKERPMTSSESFQDEVVPSFLTQSDSPNSSPVAMLGWLAGTIALLLLLAVQYLHVNSIKFAQDPGIRPILETLCPITNCPLPLTKTPRKIVTVSHDVRSHPKVNNALEVQLIFKNKANYTQGYPLLEITFSNPLGEVIARRKFLPETYLTGDIQYARGLKSNQSQEINLKIVDPDPGSLLSFQFNYL